MIGDDLNVSLQAFDLETDFGMPSAHLFVVVNFYYLLKINFFVAPYEVIFPTTENSDTSKIT